MEAYVRYCYTKFGNETKWAGCNTWFIPLLIRDDDRALKYADGSWYPKHWNTCDDVRILLHLNTLSFIYYLY